ncbi:glycosyl transferase [Aeromicrobium sp. A1-2]|uniref:CDP-glycerol glycerophosphotransferase family protein n=1 Tax=Aeromicrobium sp. A1-2 TaxID=2107713 RepID=UPI000E4A67C2|nr:CDP-glycerol glycerophosphotransferase family protein [Aeromicrobium sp. A1-2]AXT84512.1 glycosyl transferase [Aeromicrobium sp. A1-2]
MSGAIRNGRSQIQYVARALGGFPVVINLLAVLALAAAIASPDTPLGRYSIIAVAALLVGRASHQAIKDGQDNVDRLWLGNSIVARMATTAGALAVGLTRDSDGWTAAAAIILLVLLVGEQTMRRPVESAAPQAANLPGAHVALPSTRLATWIFVVNTLGTTFLAVSGVLDLTPAPATIAGAVGVVMMIAICLQAARFLVQRRRFEARLPALLKELDPRFAFHWQAPAGTAYQASMWLPYLERIGTPYFVLVRTIANFTEVSKMTTAPVILRSGLEDLDRIVTPSLRAVFYANTAVRNSHMIRFPHLTHIQLNHGDSDKIASVSPTFRQYDRNFVAGQAAIDRFATHGVPTLAEQFEIVGRPQLEDVQPARGPIGEREQPVVLYSPTWSGFYDDSNYSSLSAGSAIVQTLLERGCTVIFRPHPYARRHRGNTRACVEIIGLLEADIRRTGRPHVFGAKAETEMSVVDCFNASDAMISDVSSVTSDYLISGKPFAMAAVSAHGEAFVAGFPLARAAYVFDVVKREASGLSELVEDMLGPDSHAETRRSLRSYYLSDTPPEQIADRFLETARRYLR